MRVVLRCRNGVIFALCCALARSWPCLNICIGAPRCRMACITIAAKFIRAILSRFWAVICTKGRLGATITEIGIEGVPVAGVMVNASDWEVHPTMEGVDFDNAEKMHGVCGHRCRRLRSGDRVLHRKTRIYVGRRYATRRETLGGCHAEPRK